MLDVPMSGVTGSVNFSGSTSATFITPTLGNATATTIAFSPTTGGIVGTTTNDNTSSGNVGEYVSSIVLIDSAVNLTGSFVDTNITTISLTAGDWDVWAEGWITGGATTVVSFISFSCGITSATVQVIPDASTSLSQVSGVSWVVGSGTTNVPVTPVDPCFISLSTTTTVYFTGRASFATSTCALYGKIAARRVR